MLSFFSYLVSVHANDYTNTQPTSATSNLASLQSLYMHANLHLLQAANAELERVDERGSSVVFYFNDVSSKTSL